MQKTNYSLDQYKTIIFDCDGVILNSNKLKTDAFYEVGLNYGEGPAKELVSYHKLNGGISRYHKFDYFIDTIIPKYNYEKKDINKELLLNKYAELVKIKLIECQVCPKLEDFKRKTINSKWLIVSGGDENELREIFSIRKIADIFNGGIFGSPSSKKKILKRELSSKNIRRPALLIGDSKYDYFAAKDQNIEFIFLSCWTELNNWKKFVKDEGIYSVSNLVDI